MSVYLKNTKDFSFSLAGDGSLVVRNKLTLSVSEVNFEIDTRNHDVHGITFYRDPMQKHILKLEIADYFDTMESHKAGMIVQAVLSAFSYTFVAKGDQRKQIVEGLRYFVLSRFYKILTPNNEDALAELNKTYTGIKERMPLFDKELEELEEKARVYHIQEPFVASTGTMLYSTRDAIWLTFETLEKDVLEPEYLYIVDYRSPQKAISNIFKGKQKECIKYIIKEQQLVYGICIDDVIKKQAEKQAIMRTLGELEIVLDIPNNQRLEYLEEAEKQRLADDAALATNLTHLALYDRMKK